MLRRNKAGRFQTKLIFPRDMDAITIEFKKSKIHHNPF